MDQLFWEAQSGLPKYSLKRPRAQILEVLISALQQPPDADLVEHARACVVEYRTRLAAHPPAHADRAFCSLIGVKWDGLGFITGTEFPSALRKDYASILLDYSEIRLRAGQRDEILPDLDFIEGKLFDGFDCKTAQDGPFGKIALGICAPIASASAMRFQITGDADARNRALRHQDKDVSHNGKGREVFYRRIFALCGIDQ